MSFCSAAIREKENEPKVRSIAAAEPAEKALQHRHTACQRALHTRQRLKGNCSVQGVGDTGTVRERVMNVLFPFKGVGPLGAVIELRMSSTT